MSLRLPIYLDHNATTPVDERVFEAMRPYFCETFGNAASRGHSFGWAAEAAVDRARQQCAAILNANPNAIVWTSGSTEANNLAIKGVACAHKDRGRHIITQATEHKAVIDPCKRLQKEGYDVTVLGVDRRGRIDFDELSASIRADTILVSIMWANNEVGTIQPARKIGQLCREKGVLFHTDATQAVGKLTVDVQQGIIAAHALLGEARETVAEVRGAIAPIRRVVARFETLGVRTADLSDAVLSEVEAPVRRVIALARVVKSLVAPFMNRWSRKSADARSAPQGASDALQEDAGHPGAGR